MSRTGRDCLRRKFIYLLNDNYALFEEDGFIFFIVCGPPEQLEHCTAVFIGCD